MRHLLALILATIFGMQSCSETAESKGEKLIIGMYCGECHRNCSVIVELSETRAYADTTRAFFNWLFNKPLENYQYFTTNRGIQLSDSTQEFMNPLFGKLPENIYNYEQTIGCPDCVDQCGIYLEIDNRHWLIDTGGHDDPELEQFIDLTIESMNKVHEEVFRNR